MEKKESQFIIGCVVVLLILLGINFFYFKHAPAFLKNPELQEYRQDTYLTDDGGVRLYFFEEDNTEENQTIKEEVFESYKNESVNKFFRIEMRTIDHSSQIQSVIFEIYEQDESRNESYYQEGYILDKNKKEILQLDDLLEEKAKRRLINEWQYILKESYPEEYSVELLEKMSQDTSYWTSFFIDGNELVLFTEVSNGRSINWSFPMQELSEYLKADVGEVEDKPLSSFRYFIDPTKPTIALTFDDGPHQEFTPEIIDQLFQYNSTATFYVVGDRLDNHAEILVEIVDYGNQVGNHSWSHPYLTYWRKEKIENQFNHTDQKILEITEKDTQTYRSPYGVINYRVRQNVEKPLVMWDVDSRDWELKDAEEISKSVLNDVEDGSIVLLHDIHQETMDAMMYLLPALLNEGYQMVSVEELMELKGIEMEEGEVYFHAKQDQ